MAIRCAYRLLAVVCVAVALCCGVALASYSVDFNASDLTLSPRDGGDAVRLPGCSSMNVTWMPDVPTKGVSIAIPSNMDAIGVRIVNVEYVDLPGTYRIAPCEQPLTSGTGAPVPVAGSKSALAEAVNLARGVYPGELVRFGGCGWLSDHHLAGVTVYPVQYDTVTGALRLYTHIEFDLVMSPGGNNVPAIAVHSAAGDEALASVARSLVMNPLEVKSAPAVWGAVKAMPVDAEYLIITDASFVSSFQPLADWKKSKGYTTAIVTTSTIYSTYSGADNAAKIRACILDYKNNHGTAWVMLGGDSDFVPVRKVAPFSGWDYLPACDLYYSDLTGDWNADNVAGAETVYPADAPTPFTFGSTYSGTSYANCAASDNVYHRVTSGTDGSYRTVDFYYVSTLLTRNAPTSLTVTFEGKTSYSGTVTLYMYNYTIGDWESVRSATLGTTDATWTITVTGDPSRFVDPTNGDVPFRVYYRVSGTTTRYIYIDMLRTVGSGDALYGEYDDDLDLYPDVFVGRAPVNDTTEVATFVNKVLQYEGSPSKPTLATDYELQTLLMGGILNEEDPPDSGGTQMDYLANSVIPTRFTNTKLYQSNGTLTHTAVFNNLNAGRNIVAHAHHGHFQSLSLNDTEWIQEDQFYNMTNAPRYTGFLTTWACLCGGFDWPEPANTICESFVRSPTGGGYFIGNGTYGSYTPGDVIENLSPRMVTEQFRSLFTRNKVRAGEMLGDTVSTLASQAQGDVFLLMSVCEVNLLGDPETPVWVNTPSAMTTTVTPSSIAAGTTTSVTVNVKKGTTNVSGAKVCLWKGTEVYLVGTTNTSGNATFNVTPTTSGTVQATMTYLNDGTGTIGALLPYQSTITVTGGGGGAENVYPSTVTFTLGSTYSGTSVANCAASDNVYHRVTAASSGGNRIADYYYASTTTKTNPTALTLTYEGRVSSSGTLTLYLYNYTTSSWEQVYTNAAFPTSDTTVTYNATGTVSRFVNSSTGEVRCRVYYLRTGTTTRYVYNDFVRWAVTQ